jgi:hypothetical protein
MTEITDVCDETLFQDNGVIPICQVKNMSSDILEITERETSFGASLANRFRPECSKLQKCAHRAVSPRKD